MEDNAFIWKDELSESGAAGTGTGGRKRERRMVYLRGYF